MQISGKKVQRFNAKIVFKSSFDHIVFGSSNNEDYVNVCNGRKNI